MAASGNVIEEERLFLRRGVEFLHVPDRLVRPIGGEVVVRFADPRRNLFVVLEKVRCPLVGLAAHKAVEVIESHSDRPLIERTGDGVLVRRRVVVLAEPRRGVTIALENGADGCVVWTYD